MKLFKILKFLIFNYSEIEQFLKRKQQEHEEKLRLSKKHNLNLCYQHRQEQNRSHYSRKNCDHCKLLVRLANKGDIDAVEELKSVHASFLLKEAGEQKL